MKRFPWLALEDVFGNCRWQPSTQGHELCCVFFCHCHVPRSPTELRACQGHLGLPLPGGLANLCFSGSWAVARWTSKTRCWSFGFLGPQLSVWLDVLRACYCRHIRFFLFFSLTKALTVQVQIVLLSWMSPSSVFGSSGLSAFCFVGGRGFDGAVYTS